jgi:hypothetical protein
VQELTLGSEVLALELDLTLGSELLVLAQVLLA